MGSTGSCGFGTVREVEATSITPACFSGLEISGAATGEAARDAAAFGRKTESSSEVSCSFGRAGSGLASCTMFGSAGKILGGS